MKGETCRCALWSTLVYFAFAFISISTSIAATSFRAGFGRADITPVLEDRWVDADRNARYEPKKGDSFIDGNGNGKFDALWMAGFHKNRPSNGVHDPLYALAVVLDDETTRIAIVAIDAIGFFHNDVMDVRARIPKELGVDHVVICSTHTHEVPDLMGNWGPNLATSGVNHAYLELVKTEIVAAVSEAVHRLTPAKMEVAEIPMQPSEGFLKDTRAPLVFDSNLRVMRFTERDSGKVLGTIVNWANHPETLWNKNLEVSADFVGHMRSALENGIQYDSHVFERGVGGTHLYINGAVGGLMTTSPDVVVLDPFLKQEFKTPSHEKARAQGHVLAQRILSAWNGNGWIDNSHASIEVRQNFFSLPVKNWLFRVAAAAGIIRRKMKLNLEVETEINHIRLGDAEILTIPGEIYPELVVGGVTNPSEADFKVNVDGYRPLRNLMGGKVRFIFGLANDELGYILPKSQWDEKPEHVGGKKPYGEINSLGPDTAEILQRQVVKLLSPEPPLRSERKYELRRVFLELDESFQEEPFTIDFYESTKNSSDSSVKPLVLVGENLGGNDELTRFFAPIFANEGFHVLVVHTPKVKRVIDQIRDYSDLPKLKTLIEKTIELYRAGLDWALEKPIVDRSHVGVFGISLGAIVTSYLMATEPRIQAGFFTLTGADTAGILAHSKEKGIVKWRNRMWSNEFPGRKPDKKLSDDLERRLRELNLPDLRNVPREQLGRRVSEGARLVYAMFDQVIPRRYTEQQWRIMGKPKIDVLWLVGHYQGIIYIPQVQAWAKDWFREKLH